MIELDLSELRHLYLLIISTPDYDFVFPLNNIVEKIYQVMPDKCDEILFKFQQIQRYQDGFDEHDELKDLLRTDKVFVEWVESERFDRGYSPDKIKVKEELRNKYFNK